MDSMHQPSVAVAVASINRPERAASEEQVLPYPGFVPTGDGVPEERQRAPTSARTHYLKDMRSDGVRCDDLSSDLKHSADAHSSRPRGLSPRQGSASWASGGNRGRHSCNMMPWQSEENAILKSPREPTQSMPADLGPMAAGMFHQAGSAAAALGRAAVRAAGCEEPPEPLQSAVVRSDDRVHSIEASCVTPRCFVPPSRCPRDSLNSSKGGCRSSPNQSFSRTGSQSSPGESTRKHDDVNDDFTWRGASSFVPELQLDLPGVRRARAASSGYSRAGPQRSARWRI